MADEFLTNLPVLTDVSGSVFYAVKGGTDYQVAIGDIQGSTQPQAANLVYAGPVAAPGDFPEFRPLVLADIPDLSSLYLASTGGSLSSATINNSNIVGGTISGATATFDDNKLTIRDQTDTTKRMKFELSGVTTGATRTLHVPDESTVIVGTTPFQTVINKVIRTVPSTTAGSPLRVPHGSAPTSPVNGDIWTTTAGLYVRVNNSTVGPLAAATSSTVNSFNGRVGSVTLSSADVINALGYTPANVVTAAADADVVHITGNENVDGEKTFLKSIRVATGASSGQIAVSSIPGQISDFALESNGVSRWVLRCQNDVETGGNSGSTFSLRSRDDSGAQLSTIFTVDRPTGVLNFPSAAPTIGGNTVWHAGNLAPSDYMEKSWVLTAGNGLTGGGSGAANRTVTLGTPGTITSTTTNSVTATSHTHALTVTSADVTGALGYTPVQQGGGTGQGSNKVYIGWSGAGLKLQVDSSDQGLFVMGGRTITAGNGLSGGGDLNNDRTLALGTPGSTTLSSTNGVTASSHTHAFAPGGTTSQYIRGDGSLATFAFTVNLGLSGTTGALTVTNSAGSNAVIPVATASASGLVSTGNQTWGGTKTAVNFVATSDARLKKNIRQRLPAERLADMLRFVEYMWKDSGEESVGVIAQEVRSVAPEYVFEDENGMLAVDKAGLALECVIGLAARVRDLENK